MKIYDDSRIDALVWQAIAASDCPDDFRLYLRHRLEGAVHRDEALDRLIALDDAGAVGEPRYPAAIAAIRTLAEEGDPTAQFHIGKIHGNGLGVTIDTDVSAKWYRLAILQGETRSMTNLASSETQRGNHTEAQRINELAAQHGEPHGLIGLARMHLHGEGTDVAPATALDFFLAAWEAGDALAAYWIGALLLRGEGIRKDTALGRDWMEKAARAGYDGACVGLGNDCEFGNNGVAQDAAKAVEWYRLGAERGDIECQKCLGTIHIAGNGIHKDGAEAVKWLRMAAVQGSSSAQRVLGLAYLWGVDVVKNIRFGRKWLERAAGAGDAWACFQFARLLQEGKGDPADPAGAFRWFDKAAGLGDARAQAELGLCYWKGDGVAKDEHAAFKWIRLSALQGEPFGLYLLGWAWQAGVGVEADLVKGVTYYRQAAERGYPRGQARLGHCYLMGDGVERDVPEAVVWLTRAADQGDPEGACTIGLMLLNGHGVEPNPGEASRWFLEAAEKGDSRAQYELAILYAEGRGLARNPDEARAWMEKAAAQGEADAKVWLEQHSQLELITASEEA